MQRRIFEVGNRKQLLFDDAHVERKNGFALTMNPAVRRVEPVLLPEEAWEIGGICGDSNMSIIDDDGLLRLWYVVEYIDSKRAPKRARRITGAENLDAKMLADLRGATRRYVLCHATSSDGVHWEKPHANLVEYQGSKKNNMLFLERLGCTVFKDPSAPAAERYKMVCGGGPKLPHVHLAEDVPAQKIYHAIYGATSPDGIRWRRTRKPVVPWYTDTTNVAYWDDRIGKYVVFVRSNEGMVYRDGKTVTPDRGSRLRYRAIGRTESEDFRSFPEPVRIMEPTLPERRSYSTGVDYYNSAAATHPFAADSYFMFSSDFYHEQDTLDVRLCTSRDGVHYTRWPGPFLGLGTAGAFDSQCVYMAAGLVRQRDELHLYYAGYDFPHAKGLQRSAYSGAVGLARVRLDGFVSQDARGSGGTLMTAPLKFDGRRLEVNMDANAGGRLKVELLDTAGRPIPGFAARDADWLWGNDTAKTATWNGLADVSAVKGKPVRLRFTGRAAKLYAFQFVG